VPTLSRRHSPSGRPIKRIGADRTPAFLQSHVRRHHELRLERSLRCFADQRLALPIAGGDEGSSLGPLDQMLFQFGQP
jgi:hypothetical protein